MTPRRLRSLRTIDPACGSGIFLRTMLELQCDPSVPGVTASSIDQAFRAAEGIDRDPNACEATRLSLALLHLVATGVLPARDGLRVSNRDAIAAAVAGELPSGGYDAVITNPPYIKLDHLGQGERDTYREYLGGKDPGRLDAYVPFVKLCLDLVERSGLVCLVLPQAFLTASNAAALRRRIADEFEVRCVVDLTAVPVFEGVGAYTVLLVLQRRSGSPSGESAAQVARVTEAAGAALQACLDGEEAETPFYSVYRVSQTFFRARDWVLVSPSKLRFDDRLKAMPRLAEFMDVKQGFVTGADEVFIIPKGDVPEGEGAVFVDYLPDRRILRYSIPLEAQRAVFVPYVADVPVTERQMQEQYPRSWAYLCSHRAKLSDRASVRLRNLAWWRPERPRSRSVLLQPKIVCPHLMLTPRFAVDQAGTFAVSRAPFVLARDQGEQSSLLRFYCAVLNSSVCNWHLRTYSSKYGKGYNRLEVPTLRAIPVPDVGRVDASALARITHAVGRLSAGQGGERLDEEVDATIAGLYGFTASECRDILGIG